MANYRLRLARTNNLKLKVSARVPAQLVGGDAIAVTRANATYTVDLDYDELDTAVNIQADYEATTYVAMWESINDVWSKISVTNLKADIEDTFDGIYQPLDAELTALAGLTSAADKLPYFDGSESAALADFTAYGRSVVAVADEAAFKALVNLEIGTDVQAYDAELAAIAGLTSAADKLPYFTGAGTAAVTDFSAFGRTLVDDANAGAARTTLGLGSIATQDSNNVTITGGSVTGITDLVVADGGTGVSSFTAYAVVCGGTTGTGAVQSIASVGSSGQVLTSNGAGALPTFQDATGGSTSGRDYAHNGGFAVAQRGTIFTSASTPANNDDTYLLDQWILLSSGNDAVDVSQNTADAPTGGGYCAALDVETANVKFGFLQILEAKDCIGLISSDVVVSAKLKVSSTTNLDNVKMAIVTWSGTADSVTSDIVSAWNTEGTDPTLVANWTYENTPSNLSVTNSWATYSITGNIDTASAKQIGVFIWSDVTTTTVGGSDVLYIADVGIYRGTTAPTYEAKQFSEDAAACRRYYYRRNAASTTDPINVFQAFNTTTIYGKLLDFPVKMRTTPTIATSSIGHMSVGNAAGSVFTALTSGAFASSNEYSISSYAGLAATGAGLVAGNAVILIFNSASGYVEATAEL